MPPIVLLDRVRPSGDSVSFIINSGILGDKELKLSLTSFLVSQYADPIPTFFPPITVFPWFPFFLNKVYKAMLLSLYLRAKATITLTGSQREREREREGRLARGVSGLT